MNLHNFPSFQSLSNSLLFSAIHTLKFGKKVIRWNVNYFFLVVNITAHLVPIFIKNSLFLTCSVPSFEICENTATVHHSLTWRRLDVTWHFYTLFCNFKIINILNAYSTWNDFESHLFPIHTFCPFPESLVKVAIESQYI